MDAKRWIALGAAVVLLFVSIGVRAASSLFSTNFEAMFSEVSQLEDGFNTDIIRNGTGENIVVIHLDGVIQSGGSGGILSQAGYSQTEILNMLDEAGSDNSVDGIIIRTNTPGGGVVESDEVHDKVVEIEEKYEKPIYVSMGNTTASGGYYIASAADKIVAHPATLTGSIGVIMQSLNYAELADKIGVKYNTIKSGKYKDIMSPDRDMTDSERKILQDMVDGLFDDFVDVVVEGRDMSESKVRKLADGRVYTGKQAYENGLVDELGDLDDTIDLMAQDNDWKNVKVVSYSTSFGFSSLFASTMQSLVRKSEGIFNLDALVKEQTGPRAMYLYTN